MTVEPLTTEQIAAMLPDQVRAYLATLDQAYTETAAELSGAIGEELAAKSKVHTLRHEASTYKTRIGLAQSVLKSLREGY